MIRPPHPTNQRGFTLIEVLLAVAILATMVVMVLGAMTTSFQMRHRTAQLAEVNQAATVTLKRMVAELNMAFYVSEASEDVAQNREIRYRTIFNGKRDEIDFVTMGYQQRFSDEAAGDQAEISYRIERRRGRDGKLQSVLMRREQAPIDARPERGGTLVPVLENVERIRFEYWDPDREIGDEAWVDQWDPKKKDQERLPDRVRITIEVENPLKARSTLAYSMQADIRLPDPLLLLPADIAERLGQQQRMRDDATIEAGGNPANQRNQPSLRDQVREATGRR